MMTPVAAIRLGAALGGLPETLFTDPAYAAGGTAAVLLMIFAVIVLAMASGANKLRKGAAEQLDAHKQELAARHAALAAQARDFQMRSEEMAAEQRVLEQRFDSHRESSFRREADARARIAALEAELAGAREAAVQLAPTQERIRDLEGRLEAERGRIAALEQAVAATTRIADDLDQRLRESEQREVKLREQLATDEQTMAGDLLRIAAADSELVKLRETHESYRQQAEARITQLQRNVSAAEARAALVEKEFMTAVGMTTTTRPEENGTVRISDKRVRELEDRLAQIESDSRKRAREDGYKIAELEFRLNEAMMEDQPFLLDADPEPDEVPADAEPDFDSAAGQETATGVADAAVEPVAAPLEPPPEPAATADPAPGGAAI